MTKSLCTGGLERAIETAPDPLRARHFLHLLEAAGAGPFLREATTESARVLAALLSGSQACGTLLVAHPDWIGLLTLESLRHPRRKAGLSGEINTWLRPLLERHEYAAALAQLRQFKQREMLRIAARDLARLGVTLEVTQEISDVADVCLGSVWEICRLQLAERYGHPAHPDGSGRRQPTAGCVLGLGKLGGAELNYSSDVDVLVVYAEEGSTVLRPKGEGRGARDKVKGPKLSVQCRPGRLTNHQFFNRLAEAFHAELTRVTPEGTLYRVDFRLRPEGDMGPLSRSLASYENYYAQWGQTWERMMLLKTRVVAGEELVGAEFLEMVQPFRYPRSINVNVLSEIASMKDRIENEVVRTGELERNVKLGRGGIREIEFIAQSLQLLHAGRLPFLQGAQTLPALEKLAQYELLKFGEARSLAAAYSFLRDLEHRLQMDENRQTHTIPLERLTRERLARLMNFATLNAFETAYRSHTATVRRLFEKVLKAEAPVAKTAVPFPRQFSGAETEWKRLLADYGFRDVNKAFGVLREFVEGPGFVHVSSRTSQVGYELLARLFDLCPLGAPASSPGSSARSEATGAPRLVLSDPDRVVTRLDQFIAAYGARATLFELWNSNPAIFDLLVRLFDRSEFLAELAIHTPDLVDELVVSGRLRQRKTADETLRDLRHGLDDADQHLWLRRYHQAELMRIGLRDILGLADFEHYLIELSALADACLQYALDVIMGQTRLKAPPFAIIGLGKLGGAEIDYGSDLDLLFVAPSSSRTRLPRLARLALDVMDLLSRRTEQGLVFHTDARLRPDGQKGLLVNTFAAYEDYYRRRAQLWEIQTLTRARVVAGDAKLGLEFQTLAAVLTDFRSADCSLAAYSPDWESRVANMRTRIEKERTPAGKDALAIKTGCGGLMDAEFIAQVLCLRHGWQEPNTLRALERGKQAGALPDAEKLIDNYRQLRRVEGILRRWSYEGETVLPDQPAPYYRVAVRCGFPNSEAFRQALAGCRLAIRQVYQQVVAR